MNERLPEDFLRFFWDIGNRAVFWPEDREFITRRLLMEGDWASIQWLRLQISDEALRTWILVHQGRGLSARQIRFWELVLDLPASEADAWIKKIKNEPWEKRTSPNNAS